MNGLLAGALDGPQGRFAELPLDPPVPRLVADEIADQRPAVVAYLAGVLAGLPGSGGAGVTVMSAQVQSKVHSIRPP